MAYSMMFKRRLLDSLWDRASKGQPAPSLRFIAGEFKLSGEDAAAGMLREMQGDGCISIVGELGPYPWLTLRRQTYTGDFVRAPVWLEPEKRERVTLEPVAAFVEPERLPLTETMRRSSADPDLEEMVAEVERRHARLPQSPSDLMVTILNGPQPTRDAVTQLADKEYQGASGTARKAPGTAASAVVTRIEDRAPSPEPKLSGAQESPRASAPSEMPERPEVETAETKGNGPADALTSALDRPSGTEAGEPPAQAAETGEQAREPQPQAVGARRISPLKGRHLKPVEERRECQIKVRLTRTQYAGLVNDAHRVRVPIAQHAADLIMEAFTASQCDTGRRHRISAAVQRAWREDGRPLDVFVTDLIDLGLESYLAFRNRAEAAE
jgi:hypothetical protein